MKCVVWYFIGVIVVPLLLLGALIVWLATRYPELTQSVTTTTAGLMLRYAQPHGR